MGSPERDEKTEDTSEGDKPGRQQADKSEVECKDVHILMEEPSRVADVDPTG